MTSREHPTATITTPNSTPGQSGRFGSESVAAFVGMRRSLDDLGLEIGQDAGQGAVKDRALIGAVGEQFPEKGKQTEQGRQQRETAVAILNVGGGDDAVQQQALRIDQNMPLLALDQLAGIEAVAVDASPPFSALFTL